MMPSTMISMFMKENDFHGPDHVGVRHVRVRATPA